MRQRRKSSRKSYRRSDPTTRIHTPHTNAIGGENLGLLDSLGKLGETGEAAPAFGVDKSPWGFVSIAPGGFSSLPGPARVPGALTSGREVAALGHHGCGTTGRQPRLPFPSSHPPPQPSAHLTGTSGIRSRVAKRLFLIGVWHHTLLFSLFNPPTPAVGGGTRLRNPVSSGGAVRSPVSSLVADGGRSGLYYPVVVAAQRRHVMSTIDGSHGQTPHTTFMTWDMHLGHGRRTTKYTFFTGQMDGWNGI